MLSAASALPDDPEKLRGIIAQLTDWLADAQREREVHRRDIEIQAATLQQREQRIEPLLEYIELLRRKGFGRSAERICDDQLKRFDGRSSRR